MTNAKLLKIEMVKKGFNQRTLCNEINMSQATFTRRLRKGIFKSDEVAKIIEVLDLKNPMEIFFSKN